MTNLEKGGEIQIHLEDSGKRISQAAPYLKAESMGEFGKGHVSVANCRYAVV